VPERLAIYLDSAARYDLGACSEDELLRMSEEQVARLPNYCFCGFGFADPADRRNIAFVVNPHGKSEDIFVDDNLSPLIRGWINRNFEECIANPSPGSGKITTGLAFPLGADGTPPYFFSFNRV
jgi:hypothetical protein